jgi:hypothetical protein
MILEVAVVAPMAQLGGKLLVVCKAILEVDNESP